jgi:hypothetical protein
MKQFLLKHGEIIKIITLAFLFGSIALELLRSTVSC